MRFSPISKLVIILFFILVSCTNNDKEIPHYDNCSKIFIDGYTDKVSYNNGETVVAMINCISNTSPCNLNIYNIDKTIAFSVISPAIKQTISSNDPSAEGFGYKPTVSIPIPADLKSGVYLIENSIPFIVKPHSDVDVLVLYPSNTINAYSHRGGRSMYDNPSTRLTHASFLRPSEIQWQSEVFLKWIYSQSNFKTGFICDFDLEDLSKLPSSKILIIPGHSEYWTRNARKNFDAYVNQGHHAVILSGNTMWWQVRYSPDQSKMYCYRDATLDPEPDPLQKTITWDLPSLQYPIISSIGEDFNHGGYGLHTDNGWDGYKIVNPGSPLLEGLSFSKGDILHLPTGEYDGAPIQSFDADGYPKLDNRSLGFDKIELIGFDLGSRGGKETVGTFTVFKKTKTSGIIINAASYDWCSYRGMGGQDGEKIKTITRNAITKLLNGENVFSN